MAQPITHALLAGAFQNFNTRFEMGRKRPVWWNSIAMEIPSGTEEEVFAWLQRIPKVRKWAGPRFVNRVAANGYRLVNEDWEDTIGVSRSKLEDDRLGIYAPMFQQLGEQVAKWPDQQLAALLKANGVCWDGLAFFHDAHLIDPLNPGAGSFDNNFALALNSDNFELIYAEMANFKGEDGESLGVTPDTLWVPPKLRGTALRIIEAGVVASSNAAIDNVNKGIVKVVVVPELAGADTTWYLGEAGGALKPLVYVAREKGPLVPRTREDDPNVFDLNEYVYGVRLRGTFGYGLPQTIVRSVG